MALSYKTLQAIPRLLTYADAAKREAETKPIRGRKPEVKPLGRRSQPHIFIRRDANGDIVLGEWHGDLIRYRENGDVLIYDPSYGNKAGPNEIITEVTGIPVHTFDGKAWVTTKDGEHYLRSHKPHVWNSDACEWQPNPERGEDNIFRRVESAPGSGYYQWSYVNPPGIVVHHIRRKEMAQVMQRYANFVAYATAMDSLHEGRVPPIEAYVEPFNLTPDYTTPDGKPVYYHHNGGLPPCVVYNDFKHSHAAELCALMLSEDAADNYRAYLWLWVRSYHRYRPDHVAERIKRVVIKHHHKEVLTAVTRHGAIKDRYEWAVA